MPGKYPSDLNYSISGQWKLPILNLIVINYASVSEILIFKSNIPYSLTYFAIEVLQF
jgi:hypothetical protein